MTPNQQTDLNIWLKNTNQELPTSLDNLFIEDCLEEYSKKINIQKLFAKYEFGCELAKIQRFFSWEKEWQMTGVLFFLSRTPDGAVMPFLDTKIKLPKLEVQCEIDPMCPETLDHLLYQEFTEALRIGKTLDEALKIINKIYILERYVPNKYIHTIPQHTRRQA
jgi:hypothetical protein